MANTVIPKVKQGTATTTQDTFGISERVKNVHIINTHASQILYVRVATGATAVDALAASTTAQAASAIAAGGDNVYRIPPASLRRVKVWDSGRPTFVSLTTLASGSGTTFDVEAV